MKRLDKKYSYLCKALLLALLPFLCCLVVTAMEGQSIGNTYLPNSPWNDELFYYKQVESIVEYGYPYGYYGFNESHGRVLSFAAWSPVLVLPYILFGLLFGWNLMSPVICNILLMTVAMFLFVYLTRPSWKQCGLLTLLFCLYTPFVRYMLSGMPEVICFSHLIVFYGLAISYVRDEKKSMWKLAGMFALSGLLTLMRPYMLLFLLLPGILLFIRMKREKKTWLGILLTGGIYVAVLDCYAMIKYYFGAEYFHPLFFTDWITTFFTDGFGAGVHNFFSTLYWKGRDFYAHTRQGLRTGLASGAFFAGYLMTAAILIFQSIRDFRKLRKDKENASLTAGFVAEAHLAFSFIGMLFALLLMYKLTEGSKHLLTFMAAGVFIVAMMDTVGFKKVVLLGVTFAYLYSYQAVDPYDYQVPYVTEERECQLQDWENRFEETLELSVEQVPNYDNSVIWVYNEQSIRKETMKWQIFYALPKGFGINCCQSEYVLAHINEIQCGYLLAANGAQVDKACAENGWLELSRDEDVVLYQNIR